MKNDTKFRGQWTGTSETGSYCVTNLDQQGDAVTGRVALFETIVIDDQPFAFWTWSFLSGTVARNGRLTGEISIPSVHFRSGELLNDDQLSELLNKGGLELPTATKFSTTAASNYQLESSWTSQYPTHPKRSENVSLSKNRRGTSLIPHTTMDWGEFKEFALRQDEGLIYRGQAKRCSI